MKRCASAASLRLLAALALASPLGAAAPDPAAESRPEPQRSRDSTNGFDLSGLIVPREAISAGGPERDGVRSVDSPEFVRPEEAVWAPPPVPVIGVALADAAHAYPVHLMEHHQIVNGRLGEKPVVVAYDPLTGIPLAYQRTVKGRVLTFGVSGLLYRGQFLLYDRETESLWAHYEGRAVSGPLAGARLTRLQTRQEPMGAWFKRHPQTQVLARPERMRIDYRYSPYQAYWISEDVPWKLSVRDDRYHPKELVLGVRVKGKTRAYLGSILTSEGGRIVDEIAGVKIRIVYDSDTGTFVWEAPPDVELTDAYWFAWKSFHPDTEIWHDNRAAIEPRSSNENPPLRGSGGTTAARRAA